VKKKRVNVKGVGYQPPKLTEVVYNGKVVAVQEVDVVPQKVPEALFVRIKGWVINNGKPLRFSLGKIRKKVKSGTVRVFVLPLISPRRTTLRFGHQVFSIRKLDESLLESAKRAKEIELEWVTGGKLHHKVVSEKEFYWARRVTEVNGVKAVQYFITFGRGCGGTLIVHNTQHKDIGKDRIRCHLRNGEMLVITHLDPDLKQYF